MSDVSSLSESDVPVPIAPEGLGLTHFVSDVYPVAEVEKFPSSGNMHSTASESDVPVPLAPQGLGAAAPLNLCESAEGDADAVAGVQGDGGGVGGNVEAARTWGHAEYNAADWQQTFAFEREQRSKRAHTDDAAASDCSCSSLDEQEQSLAAAAAAAAERRTRRVKILSIDRSIFLSTYLSVYLDLDLDR